MKNFYFIIIFISSFFLLSFSSSYAYDLNLDLNIPLPREPYVDECVVRSIFMPSLSNPNLEFQGVVYIKDNTSPLLPKVVGVENGAIRFVASTQNEIDFYWYDADFSTWELYGYDYTYYLSPDSVSLLAPIYANLTTTCDVGITSLTYYRLPPNYTSIFYGDIYTYGLLAPQTRTDEQTVLFTTSPIQPDIPLIDEILPVCVPTNWQIPTDDWGLSNFLKPIYKTTFDIFDTINCSFRDSIRALLSFFIPDTESLDDISDSIEFAYNQHFDFSSVETFFVNLNNDVYNLTCKDISFLSVNIPLDVFGNTTNVQLLDFSLISQYYNQNMNPLPFSLRTLANLFLVFAIITFNYSQIRKFLSY